MPDRTGVTPGDPPLPHAVPDPTPVGRARRERGGSAGRAVAGLYALTLMLSAFLMFVVQPMVGKAVLPILGGTPAVWTTCMAFFQALLLAGYAYAHLASMRLRPQRAASVHLVMLGVAAVVTWRVALLPVATTTPTAAQDPRGWLLLTLLATVGFPFLVIAATAPMLQRWYASGEHPSSDDPYHLYAASNLGSLLALAAYPIFIEPSWRLGRQADSWRLGFVVLAVLSGVCALASWRGRAARTAAAPAPEREPGPDGVTPARWLRWVALAFVPSSLMLGVTTYLSTDIAAVPLLWVIPLGLYLLSLIAAFSRRSIPPHSWSLRAFPVLAFLLTPALAAGLVQPFWIPLHLATFFFGALACHGELVRDRPHASRLTGFYLALAVGGAAGGVFNALIAPALFDRIAEYPMALVLALLAVPATGRGAGPGGERFRVRMLWLPLIVLVVGAALVRNVVDLASSVVGVVALMLAVGLVVLAASSMRSRPRRFAFTVGAVLLVSGLSPGVDGRTLLRERNFYGVLRVTYDETARMRRLFHGSTLHGQQSVEPRRRDVPLSYFHPTGPIGDVLGEFPARSESPNVAVVGLGIGSLAAYARPGERWDFYELDPSVVGVARDPRYFTYLRDSEAKPIRILLGDARLRLAEAPDAAYRLIVLDAFSSDALPVHLMTREALDLYRRKLAPGGLLVFNLSNRYLDLDPVLGSLAADAGMACRVRPDVAIDPDLRELGKLPSIWGVVAEDEADLGPLATDPAWRPARRLPGATVWTDRSSSLLAAWGSPWTTRSRRPR